MPKSKSSGVYWSQYTGIQHAKHTILAGYLDAWYAAMSYHHKRLLYLDTHAGRGRHASGQDGSPLVALHRLLDHRDCDGILKRSSVLFLLLEQDAAHFAALQGEVSALDAHPARIRVEPRCADYAQWTDSLLDYVAAQKGHLYPLFAFVDPFSYRLSMDFLNRLLAQPKCEIMLTLMYRYANLATRHASNPSQAAHLDRLFGCPQWRSITSIPEPACRAEAFLDLFRSQLNARWVTHVTMLDTHDNIKYYLLHATNHRLGREKIKEAIWRAIPNGTYTAHENDNPAQLLLLQPEPDLSPLRNDLWAHFAGQAVRYDTLKDWALDRPFLYTHLNKVLRAYHKAHVIAVADAENKLVFKRNPRLLFPAHRPD